MMNTEIKQAKILIVDDEPAYLHLLQQVLTLEGYTNIVSSKDPVRGLGLYQEQQIDLILLDLHMPVMDGYAFMHQLSSISGDDLPPILILTAQHQKSFRQRALDNGARDFITKPFDIDELLSRVRNLIEVQIAHKYMRYQQELLEQRVAQRTQELQHTRLQVVRKLGRAAEYRDNATGLHIIRMSSISVVLGRAAGLDEQQCDLLLNAAPMHDIGKIGIPDQILLKPGKLTSEEWTIMQGHTRIGADILSGDDSDLMLMAQEIAVTHHEKWDGTGYPLGLKGNAIPLIGRITALADVFDALSSERPYKHAWSLDKALDFIQRQSGRHFDPVLVDLFLQQYAEILSIKEKFAEPA